MTSPKYLVAFALIAAGSSAQAFSLKSLNDLISNTKQTFNNNYYSVTGSLRICAANEVKKWFMEPNTGVVAKFKDSAKGVSMDDSEIVFTGSQELADHLNDANSDKCDLVVFGSDVSGLRAEQFEKGKTVSLAYSPIVFVGQKSKLDAARRYLKKDPGASLSCADLATVADQQWMGRIDPTATNKVARLKVEMSTSNSGQAGYFSCLYSSVMATDSKSAEEALATPDGAKAEQGVQHFLNSIAFIKGKSSGEVIEDFKRGGGSLRPGNAHLAIVTYEQYRKDLEEAAKNANVELEFIYPDVSMLNNFPALIVASPGSNSEIAAKAFIQTALSKDEQARAVTYGLQPAINNVPKADYMRSDIGYGDAPTTRETLHKMWELVGSNANLKDSGILNFPAQ